MMVESFDKISKNLDYNLTKVHRYIKDLQKKKREGKNNAGAKA